jgi:hypothetical protein
MISRKGQEQSSGLLLLSIEKLAFSQANHTGKKSLASWNPQRLYAKRLLPQVKI